MDTLYNTRGSHIQGRLQKLAVRVEIPSFGETERAFAVLYFKSDVDELKAEKTQAIQSIDPAIVDAIAEAVLAKLGGK